MLTLSSDVILCVTNGACLWCVSLVCVEVQGERALKGVSAEVG